MTTYNLTLPFISTLESGAAANLARAASGRAAAALAVGTPYVQGIRPLSAAAARAAPLAVRVGFPVVAVAWTAWNLYTALKPYFENDDILPLPYDFMVNYIKYDDCGLQATWFSTGHFSNMCGETGVLPKPLPPTWNGEFNISVQGWKVYGSSLTNTLANPAYKLRAKPIEEWDRPKYLPIPPIIRNYDYPFALRNYRPQNSVPEGRIAHNGFPEDNIDRTPTFFPFGHSFEATADARPGRRGNAPPVIKYNYYTPEPYRQPYRPVPGTGNPAKPVNPAIPRPANPAISPAREAKAQFNSSRASIAANNVLFGALDSLGGFNDLVDVILKSIPNSPEKFYHTGQKINYIIDNLDKIDANRFLLFLLYNTAEDKFVGSLQGATDGLFAKGAFSGMSRDLGQDYKMLDMSALGDISKAFETAVDNGTDTGKLPTWNLHKARSGSL